MKVIIYPNNFDPFTNLDLKACYQAAKLVGANKVILLPNYLNDPINHASAIDRVKMIKLGLQTANDQWIPIVISDHHLQKNHNNCCFSTIEYFNTQFSNVEWYLLLPSSELDYFPDWYNSARLLSMCQLIVIKKSPIVSRSLHFFHKCNLLWLDDPVFLSNNVDLRLNPDPYLLHPDVLRYINLKAIYAKLRLKQYLSLPRYEHSLRVAKTALKITKMHAKKFHFSTAFFYQAYTAAIYHDIAKELGAHELIKIAKEHLNIGYYPSWKTLHGPVGAWFLAHHYHFQDQTVLQAIAEHTVPRSKQTTLLSKVIYLADHLEPERSKQIGVAKYNFYWKLLNQDLDACFEQLYDDIKSLYLSDTQEEFVYPIHFHKD